MNILISGIGGPTPRSIARRLRTLYPQARLIGVDSNPKAIGFYLTGLLNASYRVPRANHPEYWARMQEIVKIENIDFAFIQPESEVLAWGNYYEKHHRYICPVMLPPLSYATKLVNKAAMAELLADTLYIPKTIRIDSANPDFELIEKQIGYPCWIRASVGSGGLGSLKLNRKDDLIAWLFIHKDIREFTVSEFLPGRHLANQMLYMDGQCILNAALECVEYVMADVAPSKVTGNTSFGRLLNDQQVTAFCENCITYIAGKLQVKPHGVFSFDLKEDATGNLKVTEINVRHMAYTGIMAQAGFDLIAASVDYLLNGIVPTVKKFTFDQPYIFLRDVDIQPILMRESDLDLDS
jgi:biotin carboxylase